MADLKKVLLQLGERRQVIDMQTFNTIQGLEQYTRCNFDLSLGSKIYFQKYEPDWNEYIEIKDLNEIENKDKLLAVIDIKVTDNVKNMESVEKEDQQDNSKEKTVSSTHTGLQVSLPSSKSGNGVVSERANQRIICIQENQFVLGPAVQMPDTINNAVELKVQIDPEKLKEDSLIYKNLEAGCFLYNYRNSLNEAAYKLALDDPTLVYRKWELQAMAKIKVDSDGYGYKRKKSRSQAFGLDEPPRPAKLTPSLRSKRIREIEEDLKEVQLEINLVERSRSKARNVNNDDRARHLTQEIAPLRKRKRKLEDELTILQKKEAKSRQQKKKRVPDKTKALARNQCKPVDTSTSQQTIDNLLVSGSFKQDLPLESENIDVVEVLDQSKVSQADDPDNAKSENKSPVTPMCEPGEESPDNQHESSQQYEQRNNFL